jgi:hypothetical protein
MMKYSFPHDNMRRSPSKFCRSLFDIRYSLFSLMTKALIPLRNFSVPCSTFDIRFSPLNRPSQKTSCVQRVRIRLRG